MINFCYLKMLNPTAAFLLFGLVLVGLVSSSSTRKLSPASGSVSRDTVFNMLTAETETRLKELKLKEAECGLDSYFLLASNSCVSCKKCVGENYNSRCGKKCQVYTSRQETNLLGKSLQLINTKLHKLNQTISQSRANQQRKASRFVNDKHVLIWPPLVLIALLISMFIFYCVNFKERKSAPRPISTVTFSNRGNIQSAELIQRASEPPFNNRADCFSNIPPVSDNPV